MIDSRPADNAVKNACANTKMSLISAKKFEISAPFI